MASLKELHELGQSTWLNYLRRSFLESGELRERIIQGVQGITANAATFERTVRASTDYDEAIRREVSLGTPARRIFGALMVYDVQVTADILQTVYQQTGRQDGFISLELDPALIHDTISTVAEVRHLIARLNRPNAMVEVPATPEGIQAVRELTRDGVNLNVTHIFSVETYEQVAQAYIDGLEAYFASHSVWRMSPTSVASFSVSAIDSAVDPLLVERGHVELQGKTAVSLARILYHRSQEIFSGPRWEKLARQGARILRPKWTRTTPRNFNLPQTYYIESLIGPDTVTTFSLATLNAFLNHGKVAPTLSQGLDEAREHLVRLAQLDIDLDSITQKLQRDYLIASEKRFQSVVQTLSRKREELEYNRQRLELHLGDYEEVVTARLKRMCEERVMCRIWAHDHTVWQSDPTEIENRLGWLHVTAVMEDNLTTLNQFTRTILDEEFTHAVLIGMGGSSLAPELFQNTFGKPAQPPYMPHPFLDLKVLDTTDPDTIAALDAELDLTKTLFIVSTKSGTTVETISGFNYFYNRVVETVGSERAGRHFVAITDPGSPLVETAQRYQFRQLFLNDPEIGGRYSALSFFGLVPAALVGADVGQLVERAAAMAANTEPCHCGMIEDNMAAVLGAVLGDLAENGRNKLTLLTSLALRSFGDWVEQLIAESTGKQGKGILPVTGETVATPDEYGDDRLFVVLRLAGDRSLDTAVSQLIAAGHPVVTFHLDDLYDLGGQFFLWEMATAVAGHILHINPFDQPNVEAAKIRAREMLATYRKDGTLPTGEFAPLSADVLHNFLTQAKPGDYVAIHAYLPRNPQNEHALQRLREFIRQQTRLATTVGYGPRFLHSTGQLHKGDAGRGLFIQLLADPQQDLPIPDAAGAMTGTLTFGVLKAAQALGDAQALLDAGRRVIRFHLGPDPVKGIEQLMEVGE